MGEWLRTSLPIEGVVVRFFMGVFAEMSISPVRYGLQQTNSGLNQAPDLESYLERASALELARRSMVGAPVYAVISLIMLAGTPIIEDYGWVVAIEVLLLIVLGIIRFWFARGFEPRYDRLGERAVIQFSILTALQSLTLGVVAGVVIWHYWAAQEVVLTIVLSAGCVAAGTSALSVRRSAQVIFLVCVLVPFGLAVLIVGGIAKALLIIGYLVLMAFLVQDGGLAKHSYMQQLRDNYDSELARRWTAAEQLSRKKFMADMNHEFRTPINSIIGMTALLLDENLERRPLEFAAIIRDSGKALLNLIEATPDSIKARPKEAVVEGASYLLRQNVTQVIERFRTRAEGKGIALISQLDDLPNYVSFLDDNYLEQVLVNLLRNAVEHTRQGTVTLSASCQDLENEVMRIEFAVADTGTGIPAGQLDSVFNPFGQSGAKTSSKFGGGLGLPMSRGLTELMGGKIWIESKEGQGTTVRFTIRVQVDAEDASWHSAGAILGRAHEEFPSDLGKQFPLQILVVEDHAINRRVLCQLLAKLGYQADEVVDGQEAVAAAMNGSYDLIFMDLRMPNMGGIEATRWIREHFNKQHLSIVALTGEATGESRDRCLAAGMDDFLPKPVQVEDLAAILRQIGGENGLAQAGSVEG